MLSLSPHKFITHIITYLINGFVLTEEIRNKIDCYRKISHLKRG